MTTQPESVSLASLTQTATIEPSAELYGAVIELPQIAAQLKELAERVAILTEVVRSNAQVKLLNQIDEIEATESVIE